ncbi:hypothetical protein ABG874_02930 [Bifidobacterium pseudocatenulatum]|uniref:hypothetical protein n=1 Tax=Bifidobacterium pseudocatenulatum TaxID=28026 RepID=UPI00232FCC94|nr:hypothetical protein [Bifidobacterium pseudocatenulatum]MDB6508540.1 hypothetical protein [Bifidobacterium pseudocatenulatum]
MKTQTDETMRTSQKVTRFFCVAMFIPFYTGNRKRFFKPTETPLFLTVFIGLTGFEPATFCFRGAFLCWIKWLLLRPISLENGGFWFLVVFVEPAGIDPP